MKNRKSLIPLLFLALFILPWTAHGSTPPANPTDRQARMAENLEKLLGTKSSWKPAVFLSLRWGMSCEEVRAVFPGLTCNNWKQYDFPKIQGKPLGMVAEYQFTFKTGKLESAIIVFNSRLFDANTFRAALYQVTQQKWGQLTPDQMKQAKQSWYNADRDVVTLSFTAHHWQLLVTFPRREAKPITSTTLSEAEIREQLIQLLGTGNNWVFPVFSRFRYGMYCTQVRQIYATLSGCDPARAWSYGSVTINGHPLVQSLKFAFNLGQLRHAMILFHPHINRALFKKASLELFLQKWGGLHPDQLNNDTLTFQKPNLSYVQRSFARDHWEIRIDFFK